MAKLLIEGIDELEKEIEEHCETKGLLGKQVFALTKRVDELAIENLKLKEEVQKWKKWYQQERGFL